MVNRAETKSGPRDLIGEYFKRVFRVVHGEQAFPTSDEVFQDMEQSGFHVYPNERPRFVYSLRARIRGEGVYGRRGQAMRQELASDPFWGTRSPDELDAIISGKAVVASGEITFLPQHDSSSPVFTTPDLEEHYQRMVEELNSAKS